MSHVYEPESEADAAGMIADAAQAGRALAISGGNTRAGFGQKVEGATFTSKRLRGITAYNPSEMTLTALAEPRLPKSRRNWRTRSDDGLRARGPSHDDGHRRRTDHWRHLRHQHLRPAPLRLRVPRATACSASASSTAWARPSSRAAG